MAGGGGFFAGSQTCGDVVAQPVASSAGSIRSAAGVRSALGGFGLGILDLLIAAGFSGAGLARGCVDGLGLRGLERGDLLAHAPALHGPAGPAGERGCDDGGCDVGVDQRSALTSLAHHAAVAAAPDSSRATSAHAGSCLNSSIKAAIERSSRATSSRRWAISSLAGGIRGTSEPATTPHQPTP